mgnify:CR=1 FL=1
MSTRCQVQVIQEGLDELQTITLYHHSDGYPEHIIPCILKGFQLGKRGHRFGGKVYKADWELGRAGKAASYLCAAHPGSFEPEAGHELHGDIRFYYRLYLGNQNGGTYAEKPRWEIEVYEPTEALWDAPPEKAFDCLRLSIPRLSVEVFAERLAQEAKDKAEAAGLTK